MKFEEKIATTDGVMFKKKLVEVPEELPATNKNKVRAKIRAIKDIEDDLVDQKQLLQFMARGFAGLWASLPQDIKDANPYKDNFDAFSMMIIDSNVRLDLEIDQAGKIAKIIQDESDFATIVKEEYLDKR